MHFRSNVQRKPEMVEYISNELMIKKRYDTRDNEVLTERKEPTHIAPAYGDRFIPRRYALDTSSKKSTKFYGENRETITDILKWDLPHNYLLQNCMKDALKKCLNMRKSRVLNFTDTTVQFTKHMPHAHFVEKKLKKDNSKDWACNPRTKPYAFSESTHDSVGFSNCFGRNMMDWSINGQVVASFENDVIIWRHIRDISITFNVENTSCLAYCPKGKYLALGCSIHGFPGIELWDVNKYSVKVEVVQRVSFISTLQIQCIEWSKCGRLLLCGTSKGALYVLSVPKLKRVRVLQPHYLSISMMRFSPTMRFLASVDIAGNIVIYDWFSFKVFLNVRCKRKSDVVLDWHPWNGVELAIAEQMPASIVLLHVPSKKITAFYRRKDKRIRIHSITFNKITAELLLSISREDSNGIVELKVIVLASLDRIVDVLTMENGARFLMWDPEGTRVVTAGTDDSLTIWNFYPKKDCTKGSTQYQEQLSTMLRKEFYSCCDYGTQFRLWSTMK